jgi:hypothetical protein
MTDRSRNRGLESNLASIRGPYGAMMALHPLNGGPSEALGTSASHASSSLLRIGSSDKCDYEEDVHSQKGARHLLYTMTLHE